MDGTDEFIILQVLDALDGRNGRNTHASTYTVTHITMDCVLCACANKVLQHMVLGVGYATRSRR